MKQLTTRKVIAYLNIVHKKYSHGCELSVDGLSAASRYAMRRAEYTLSSRQRLLGRGRGQQEVDIQAVEGEAKEDKFDRRFHV